MPQTGKTFRIFVSSTFSDMIEERNALQERVFPKLRELCIQRGCRFQAIDLRWGVSEEAALDQQAMNICLNEIKRCQKVTPRPNFVVLLGDRYGWRPLPAQIEATEFEEILSVVSENDGNECHRWYIKDDNAIPPEYCLQPRKVDFIGNETDEEKEKKRDYESKQWGQTETELRSIFIKAIDKLGWAKDDSRRIKYEASATHQEIISGALDSENAKDHVFCYFRSITNPPSGSEAKDFIDSDKDSKDKLNELKCDLDEELPEGHVYKYDAIWGKGSLNTVHLDNLCKRVEDDLGKIILEEIDKIGIYKTEKNPDLEIDNHWEFAEERSKNFVGRTDVLDRIRNYVTGKEKTPLVIHGKSGCGKTAIMANMALELREKGDVTVISRFIGATPESSVIGSLLMGICGEINESFGFKQEKQHSTTESEYEILSDYVTKLVETFHSFITKIPQDKCLVIFLDAIDQLNPSDNALTLFWLPRELPENVKIVLSAIDEVGSIGEPMRIAQRIFPENILLPIMDMSYKEGEELLKKWLICPPDGSKIKRKLQDKQQNELLSKFAGCPLPLYLKLAFEEARLWKSYNGVPKDSLGADIKEMLEGLFDRLEEEANHGDVLVKHSMGYLASARNGLTEDEMLDVLSTDCKVMNDFKRRSPKSPEVSRLPVVVWSRLYFDLESYLTERSADQTSLLSFYHRQVGEVAMQRYMVDNDGLKRHGRLADYFGDKIAGYHQPHLIDVKGEEKPNYRKMSELPYQQTYGQKWQDLGQTLTDLKFIEAKYSAGMAYDLVADYDRIGVGRAKSGPPIRTAWLYEGKYGIYCPFCLAWSEINKVQLGETISCPTCGSKIKINSFFAEVQWHPSGPEKIVTKVEKALEHEFSQELSDFADFARSQGHILSIQPKLLIQQALNQPDNSAVFLAFHFLYKQQKHQRLRWIRWVNKPQARISCLMTLTRHIDVHTCVYSPDGKRIVSGSYHKELKIWDAETGKSLHTLTDHIDSVNTCAYSPDGRIIVSGSKDKTLKIWNADTGEEINTLTGHTDSVRACAYSPDGKRIVSGSNDKTIRIWDAKTGQELHTLTGHASYVSACAYSIDGKMIVSGSWDNTLKIWDAETGKEIHTLIGHRNYVNSCSYSPDGKRIVSGSYDNTLKIWNAETGKELYTLTGHTDYVNFCSYSPDGKRIVSGSWDKTLKIWDAENGKELHTLIGHTDYVHSCFYSPDGVRIASGSETLKVWDAENEEKIVTFTEHTDRIEACSYSPDSRKIVSGSNDKTLKIWDAKNGKELHTLTGHTDSVRSCAYSPDSKRIASGSDDGTLKIWDAKTAQELHTFDIQANSVLACSYSPDSKRIVSGLGDMTLKIWDTENKKELHTLTGHRDLVFACAYSPDGKRIASGSWDQTLKIWDAETGMELHTLTGHAAWVFTCAYSPDGKKIVSGAENLKVWDAHTGEELNTLAGHKGLVWACAYSSDGKRIMSGSDDMTIRIWDAETGEEIAVFFANGGICSLAQGGQRIAAGDNGGNIYILEPIGFDFGPSFTTPVRLYLHSEGQWDKHLSARCEFCGMGFVPEQNILDAIHGITGTITQHQHPYKKPHDKTDELQLLSECPYCHRQLLYNPFTVDNKEKIIMSELEDFVNRIKQLPNPTLLVFTFPSLQDASNELMKLSFAKTELMINTPIQRILWKLFVIKETGKANLVMGGNMNAKERDEAIKCFSELGETRAVITPES